MPYDRSGLLRKKHYDAKREKNRSDYLLGKSAGRIAALFGVLYDLRGKSQAFISGFDAEYNRIVTIRDYTNVNE